MGRIQSNCKKKKKLSRMCQTTTEVCARVLFLLVFNWIMTNHSYSCSNCSTADLWPRKAWSTHFPGCKLYCFWTWYTFLQSASMDLRVGITKDYLSIRLWGTSWLHCCRAFHWSGEVVRNFWWLLHFLISFVVGVFWVQNFSVAKSINEKCLK